ncbi:E3 ubiquitin-protein ligase RNF139-like isoform X2 [Macrobrachium nipponense]
MESEEWDFLKSVVHRARRRYLNLESLYMEMKNASVLVNQVVFFSLCERIFLPPSQRMSSSLHLDVFLNVIAYCVSYVKELIEREDWSMYVNIARTSNVRHLALSTTKIVLEWTKAVTFIITVVCMLLVFGLEKGLKNYMPTTTYLLITGFYFLMTEKVFIEMLFAWLDNKKFDYFEGMETFYCPALLLTLQITLSSLFVFLCFVCGNFRLAVLSSFTNVRVKYRELRDRYLLPLSKELSKLSCYRMATPSEIRGHDDVCAICLTAMSCARITPCQHFFHADCLRRCLKESYKCPICQYDLHKSQSIVIRE